MKCSAMKCSYPFHALYLAMFLSRPLHLSPHPEVKEPQQAFSERLSVEHTSICSVFLAFTLEMTRHRWRLTGLSVSFGNTFLSLSGI